MRRNGFLLVMMLGLAACSGRPGPEVLAPMPAHGVAGAKTVTVHAVTTRADAPDMPFAFGRDRSGAPQYAAFDISIPPGHQPGQIEWPEKAADPETAFVTLRQTRMGRQDFSHQIAGQRVALYVHGYNTSFQEALYRLAQLSADVHVTGTPVLFSWPSEARVAAYLADRDGADYSRSALADLLQQLTANAKSGENVQVLAHSMGARLMMEALRELEMTGRGAVIDRLDITLAAPDIDLDLFREQLAVLHPLKRPITVLVSSDDNALKLSSRLAAGRPRLGLADVHDPRIQQGARQSGITIVDITALPAGDSAHSRYVGLISAGGLSEDDNPLQFARQAGAFVFNQIGATFGGIGSVLEN